MLNYTIEICRRDEFFIGFIKEFPGVISQGKTMEETKANVLDALELYLEDEQ